MKPSKSAVHVGVSAFFVSFDIGSIGTRHETSGELSSSSVDDVLVSWCIIPVCERFPTRDGQRVAPPMTAPLFSAVSNPKVRLSRELVGTPSKNSADLNSGRRPMSETDEFFEGTPTSFRDNGVSKS